MKKLPDCHPDTPSFEQLRAALKSLAPRTSPRWGKMDAAQMLAHCDRFALLYLGEVPIGWPTRSLARLLGPLFLAKVVRKSPTETPKNLGTLPAIRVRQSALALEEARDRLLASLSRVEQLSGQLDHVLYGSMHAEDCKALVRHHTAHHVNQFGLL